MKGHQLERNRYNSFFISRHGFYNPRRRHSALGWKSPLRTCPGGMIGAPIWLLNRTIPNETAVHAIDIPEHGEPPLPVVKKYRSGFLGYTTTTDLRSQRNRTSRRGGQITTRPHSSSDTSACPPFVLPTPQSRWTNSNPHRSLQNLRLKRRDHSCRITT